MWVYECEQLFDVLLYLLVTTARPATLEIYSIVFLVFNFLGAGCLVYMSSNHCNNKSVLGYGILT